VASRSSKANAVVEGSDDTIVEVDTVSWFPALLQGRPCYVDAPERAPLLACLSEISANHGGTVGSGRCARRVDTVGLVFCETDYSNLPMHENGL
jgi:hypothetical protein